MDYKPLSIPKEILPQSSDYAYGDVFMSAYNDMIKTEYNKALAKQQQLQVENTQRTIDKAQRKEAADMEFAKYLDISGETDYSKALEAKARIYDEKGLGDESLILRKNAVDYSTELQDRLAKSWGIQGGVIYQKTPDGPVVKGRLPESGSNSGDKPKAPKLEEYVNQNGEIVNVNTNDPEALAFINQNRLIKNSTANRVRIEDLQAEALRARNSSPNQPPAPSNDPQKRLEEQQALLERRRALSSQLGRY